MGVISSAPSYCHPHPNLPPSEGEGAYDNENIPALPEYIPLSARQGGRDFSEVPYARYSRFGKTGDPSAGRMSVPSRVQLMNE